MSRKQFASNLPLISGVSTFELFSSIMAYSMCIYAVTTVIICFILGDLSSVLFSEKIDFLTTIFYSMLILILFTSISSPVLLWLDASNYVDYINKWTKFQMLFLKVTHNRLSLNVKKRCIFNAIRCSIIGFSAITFHFFIPYLSIWQIPGLFYTITLVNCYLTLWIITCRTLSTAGKSLSRNFKEELRRKRYTAQSIGRYRILWLRLSQLVSGSGGAMEKTSCLFFAVHLFIITMSLYGFLYGITSEAEIPIQSIGMGIGTVTGGCTFYVTCNAAHKVHLNVKVEIEEELQLIMSSRENHDVLIEVNAFLNTISSHPPVISVAGFFDVNREMLRSVRLRPSHQLNYSICDIITLQYTF
ncbi:gustatory and odorant receptor 24-like isoform X1 [Zootermopsis nevadensis]|uniref:gustatory and odorant receptor 24-like isoform X1 n=2 Tax=Zootermopsis nevadensis TaxID=136037 RepID=UPI000B8E71EA|nr:gustatory and odorant receptor 24-like isoform X1 [Zootermopsis nevadensis]